MVSPDSLTRTGSDRNVLGKILAADGRTYGLELFCILRYFGNRALAGTQNGPRVEYP